MFLAFEHVTKFYGPVIGVNDVDCRVGPGITGLLGANGAGKSTLIKLASGQLRPSLGRVTLGEHDAWSTAAKRLLGYCPDSNHFYEEMSGREFVGAMAALSGFSRRERRQRTEQALERVGMSELADRRLGGCSYGMRQRVKLAQALVHDPPILLLDEPLLGVDPRGRRELNELFSTLADEGKTILVSSHLLDELELLAERLLVIARGRLVAAGTPAQVRDELEDQPLVVELVSGESRRLAALLAELPEVRAIELTDETLLVRTTHSARFFATVGELVLEHEIDISRMRLLDAGAEAIFEYLG